MTPTNRLPTLVVAVLALVLTTVPAAAQQPAADCDFDADGFADLATGVPREDLGSVRDAGAVHVLHGDGDGRLRPRGNDLWNQGDRGIVANRGRADQVGLAVACGDFDADGFADLAAGVPGETIAGDRAGAVHIFYGSADGISRRDDLWHQDSDGIKGGAEEDDQFGSALSTADFDGDGFADLAVGIPGEDIAGENGAGAAHILYGSAIGVSQRDDLWHQNDDGISATAGARNFFGADVAGGDFNRDGFADVAIGVPGEGLRGSRNAGAVAVLYGSADGLTRTDDLWHQADEGVQGGPETADHFGNAVAAADFEANGGDDLIIGIPGEDIGGVEDAGAVQILYGRARGVTAHDALLHQDDRGIAARAGDSDQFGHSVDAGDFDGDGHPDLATGVVGEVLAGNGEARPSARDRASPGAGAVHVLYGSSAGITDRDQLWHQNDEGVAGASESGDLFGFDVFAADFDGDGSDDLAAGVPGEGIGSDDGAGAVQTLYGGDRLLTARGELWHQGDGGVAGGREPHDNMGWSLP